MARRKSKDALEILQREIGEDEELRALVAEEHLNARVARMVREARKDAQFTQAQLGELVGTTQSAIARLEDSDYEGHSLSMLQRIAAALGRRLEIEFVENRPETAAT